MGYVTNIETDSIANENFRQVIFTAPNSQLVLMSLKPGEEIGLETHDHGDQFIRVEAGSGKAVLAGKEHELGDGSAVVIPAGVEHNIVNTSQSEELKRYTLYTPAEHPDGTVHRTKAEADEYEKQHHH